MWVGMVAAATSTAGTVDVFGLPVGILDIGATGLLVVVFLLAITGQLIGPKGIKRLVKEADTWREAFFESQRQKDELLKAGQVTQQVLRALEERITRGGEDT